MLWAVKNYLAFRLGERNLASYEPIFADRKHIFLEREKQQDTGTVTLDEVRKLVLAANTRDRAIILCSVCGFGVAEFLDFANDWHKYVEDIRKKTVPLKVSMTRGKTGVRFYTKTSLARRTCVRSL